MKFFVVFACALAAASASIIAPVAPIHLPVIGPNGVPVDTTEVQHARAAHAVHMAEAHVRNGDVTVVAPVDAHTAVVAPVVGHHAVATPIGAHTAVTAPVIVASAPQHLPIIDSTGVPVDTAEVQHARAAHAIHKAEAHARNGDVAVVTTPVVAHHALATPVVSHTAVSQSFIAHPILSHHLVRRRVYAAYPTTFEVPVVAPNGVPLDTLEVAAAKANHFTLVSEALARNGHYAAHVASYVPYADPYVHVVYPALAANGAPLETPEVVAAKAAHFTAHAEANARTRHYIAPITPVAHGVPQETPEVAAAKTAHFAAHADALARNVQVATS